MPGYEVTCGRGRAARARILRRNKLDPFVGKRATKILDRLQELGQRSLRCSIDR